jgi:hypothetical protein
MSAELVDSLEHLLRGVFKGAGLASALSEVKTCQQHPEYLAGLCELVKSQDLFVVVYVHAMRRGFLWEPL